MANQTVKIINQKVGSDFTPYPIGVDAENVDMQSVLSLEEELKIGGNKCTKIQDKTLSDPQISYTQIIEYYTKEYIPISVIPSSAASVNFTVFSYIKADIQQQYPIQVEEEQTEYNIPDTLGETPLNTIVSVQGLASNERQVIIHLYPGYKSSDDATTSDASNLLHQKIVKITSTSQGGA